MRLRVAPPPASREGDPPLYTVTVDDRAPEVLPVTPGEHRYVLATRLDVTRPHRVTIVRESEALAGEHQLLGFELVPGGELLATPEPPARRRIEIIGDSITCGYGILGRGADCSFSFATERASLAYGARLGRALDADVTTVCWSGRGVYRNYDEPDAPTMPQLWTPARVAPDAVVVNLGTNDVLAPRAPLDPEELERAYDTFLGRIREAYPAPLIVVVVSPMLEGEVRTRAAAILARVVERRSKAGDPRVLLVPLPEQGDRVGCDAHPNEEVHAAMAKELERVLAPRLR